MEKKASVRQAFYYALINYIGTAIGIVSVLFIYPNDKEFLGTVRFVESIAQLIFPVMVLGASHALIKFYPALDAEHKKQLFNYSLLSVAGISLAVFGGIMLFTAAVHYHDSVSLFLAFPIAVSLAYIELFKKQAQDLQKIAVPTLYEKIIPKIALPALFLLLLNNILGVFTSLVWYVVSYVLIFILTAFYLFNHFKPGINYRFKTLFGQISRKDYFRYSLYAFAGSLGSMLAFRIDSIVISEFISKEANGAYSMGVTLAAVLQIPAVGMFALYAPIISDYLKKENFTELEAKYKQVASLLLFIGAVMFSCIVLGLDDLFRMLPTYDNLKDTIPVILILGFNVVINMATGFNSEIITYSKYYRFNLITILFLIAVNVTLNVVFINAGYGIAGVAWASFISMVLFNIAKMLFIYKKFGLLPFDRKFGVMLLVFLSSGMVIYFLPDSESHLVNLIYKAGLSFMVNVTAIYRLRLVYQVNIWADQALKKLKLKS